MTIGRSIPEHCEIVGDIFNHNAAPVRCKLAPKRAVSVNELSPVFCCNSHGKEMSRFWSTLYPTENIAIPNQ